LIQGTQLYNAEKGAFVDLGILDVLQIFGRAGRPQFDKHGEGMIITTHDKLSQYLSLLTRQQPIESQFVNNLTDNLNAEIALGSVSDIDEAVKWLTYTYLYVRMRLNPLAYGISYDMKQKDPFLEKHRFELIVSTARKLDKARMVRFNERTQSLSSTDLGRTASHFYIKYPSIEVFNEKYKAQMTEADVLAMIAQSTEFEQIKVREEEVNELTELMNESCVMPVQGGVENTYGKVNILLQSYVSCATIDTFSLVSDTAYVSQNAARIIRALFEIAVHRGWPTMAERLLTLCKTVDRRLWAFRNPLWQFSSLSLEIMRKLEAGKLTVDRLRDMPAEEIGHMVRHVRMGSQLKQCVNQFPALSLAANIKPITRTVLMVRLTIEPEFEWNDHIHGGSSEPWWIWVEDVENDHLYHSEYFLLLKKHVSLL
jgi:activating signal cointegrator complex subunit 3